MKINPITSALLALLLLASARAEESPTDHLRVLDGPPGTEKRAERRMFIRHDDEPAEMENVPFLGVETARVSGVLASQLNLPRGTGLVVRVVVANSPVTPLLQANDVLTKLDDQILIEGRQLSVLIRNHKKGDEVTLSYIRGGKPATAKVKLAEHQVRKIADLDFPGSGSPDFLFTRPPGEVGGHAEMDHVLTLIKPDERVNGEAPTRLPLPGKMPKGFRSSRVDVSNSNMVFSDEQGTLELTSKGGTKTLIAKKPSGEQIFSGPVETAEQREKLPAEVRERLKKLDSMEEFDFRSGEPGAHQLRVIRPEPTSFERHQVEQDQPTNKI